MSTIRSAFYRSVKGLFIRSLAARKHNKATIHQLDDFQLLFALFQTSITNLECRAIPVADPPLVIHLGGGDVLVVHRRLNLLDGYTGRKGLGDECGSCGVNGFRSVHQRGILGKKIRT